MAEKEARQTKFLLHYRRKSGDPPVKLVKSNDEQTEWRNTPGCRAISLH